MPRKRTKHTPDTSEIKFVPKTDRQAEYYDALSGPQVIVFGPAGTGKTYVAATYASQGYQTQGISKIVITRPMVAVGRDIGYLPGDLNDKCAPWALPVLDVLERHLGKGVVETAVKNGNIEVAPLALMRGRSFDYTFIICDEAQNIEYTELKMLLTRIGEGSRLVLNGDIQQSDLRSTDGLSTILKLVEKYNLDVPVVEFGVEDIVRSPVAKMWVETFMKEL